MALDFAATPTNSAYLRQCFFPNMLVIILMNSWYLGVNIGMGTTYATLLEAPPYNWAPKWVGVAQAGQIVVAFIALPALGIFSDKLITYMAKRNEGVHERKSSPPVRLYDTYPRLPSRDAIDPSRLPRRSGCPLHRPLRRRLRPSRKVPLVRHHLFVLRIVLCIQ